MGSQDFFHTAPGETAKEAFRRACEEAEAEYGHQEGYSGQINNKHNFVMISREPMDPARAMQLADKLIEEGDSRIDSKDGPAGCIQLIKKEGAEFSNWFFFGWSRC